MSTLLSFVFIIFFVFLIFRDKICRWINDRVAASHTPDQYGPASSITPAPRFRSQICDKNSAHVEQLTSSYENFQKRENVEENAALEFKKYQQISYVDSDSFLNRTTCGHTATCINYGKSFCPMSKGESCYSCLYFSLRISEYGAQVRGHFRRYRNGKYSWVKSHRRRT